MNRRFLKLFILTCFLPLISCGQSGSESVSEQNISDIRIYTGDIEDKGEKLRYELTVSENGACIFDQYYLNDDGSYVLYHSEGMASEKDYGFYVTYTIGGEELYGEIYTDEETIIGAYSDYLNTENEYSEIAGMYDCVSDSSMLLSVDKSGAAKLAVGDKLYENTQLYIYEDNWDLMVFNETNELLFDWFVTFNDDGTFEYKDYAEIVFSAFAGTYTCEGPLGEFDMTISDLGEAAATVMIDGISMDFTGIVTVYEQTMINAYLESEEGYELTLNFTEDPDKEDSDKEDSDKKTGDDHLPYTATYKVNLN